MKKILILGGTGFLGSHLCEKLSRLPCRVSLVTRKAANARHLQLLPMLDVIELDPYNETALSAALAGHDAVINLVAILHGNEASFNKAHVQLPQTLVQACRASGVRRIVHVSALGASGSSDSLYQRSKAQGEALLKISGLDVTVLRPSVIFGNGDRFLNTFANLQQMLPVIPLAGSEARFQPVWVEDVANALVRCLQDPGTIGQTFEACGPKEMSLRELVRFAGQCTGLQGGKGRPVIGLPDTLARVQAWLMEWMPGEPLLSRDNLDAMKTPNVASGSLPGLSALGLQPASVEAIAPSYLGAHGLRSNLMLKRKTAGRF